MMDFRLANQQKKIVYSANKVDEEAVREALTAALQTLQVTIEKSGISLTVLNKVADVIKTLLKKIVIHEIQDVEIALNF